ncbi:hypothetical protein H5410_050800 [Solanum commersonii]|uniref:Uncharacterized protein n=1 Tax=Solanum commersonii TaxID=4109 RepID=A0A9J5WY51_SOLCO|nr:hypothetical protein H5410_050800 [Solanum commersonii]
MHILSQYLIKTLKFKAAVRTKKQISESRRTYSMSREKDQIGGKNERSACRQVVLRGSTMSPNNA